MKKVLQSVLALAIVAAVFTSCKKDEILKQNPDSSSKQIQGDAKLVKKTFTAGPQGQTRTTMLSGGQLVWSEGDQLKVFTAGTPEGKVFSITDGEGTPTARFEGMTEETGPYVAAYPASDAISYDGTNLIMEIPSTQQYAAGSYSTGTIPVVAYTADGNTFAFINVCQFVRVSLRATEGTVTATKIVLESKVAEKLGGVFQVNPQTGAMVYKSGVSSSITLECPGGVNIGTESDIDFYFCVPAGTLTTGYRVAAIQSDGTRGIMAESNDDISKSAGVGTSVGLTAIPVKVAYYGDMNPKNPESHYSYKTFTFIGDEVIFKWELERSKVLWFRPIINMTNGDGTYRDMKFNDIVYNDIPWHFPHMYGYKITGLTETAVSKTPIEDARTVISQNYTWELYLPDQYGDDRIIAGLYYILNMPNPTLRNDGSVPKTITLKGKLIKTGEDARTVELVAGMNEVCNYNTKMLDLNKLKEWNSGLEIYIKEGSSNLSEIDASVPNSIFPSYCFAIKSETAQTIVIPENCYTELNW